MQIDVLQKYFIACFLQLFFRACFFISCISQFFLYYNKKDVFKDIYICMYVYMYICI